VTNGVIFLLQDAHVGDNSLVDRGVPTGEAIDQGEIWRPLSSLLVHPGGRVHLGINTALLVAVGGAAERELGRNKFVLAYFGAGFAANAARYALGGRTGGGASAAIFAVAGAGLASWFHRSGRARQSDVQPSSPSLVARSSQRRQATTTCSHWASAERSGTRQRTQRAVTDSRWSRV
jgi:membrane associated rhomboid family serine protease